MRTLVSVLLVAAAACSFSCPAPAQTFIPKAIRFRGDPEYTAQELLAATGLESGEVLNFDGMSSYSQKLLASGMFSDVAFTFDGVDLVFSLKPSTDLYPIQLDNLPLQPGAELDAQLHALVPLFHGKVPSEAGLNDDIRAALQQLLAKNGITATVIATPAANLATHRVSAIVYSIAAPAVVLGDIRFSGVSPEIAPAVQKAVEESSLQAYDTENSGANLRQAVEQVYFDRGYAGAKVRVEQAGPPSEAADGIRVPFSIAVEEGRIYKLAAIHLPADAPVTQQEIAKIVADRPYAPLQGVRIRSVWELLSSRYKSQGRLDCKIDPEPQLDPAAGTVSYNVNVDPGPVYHLGFVKFDNVSDDLRNRLMHYWQMMPGDVFDESYVSQFIGNTEKQDAVLKSSLAGVKTSFQATAYPDTHLVNVVIRLSR